MMLRRSLWPRCSTSPPARTSHGSGRDCHGTDKTERQAGHGPSWPLDIVYLSREKGKNGDVHAWILRDDTPFGQVRGGRQTWFEDDDYQRRDALGRIAETDNPRSAIQRGGAFNGLFTAPITETSNIVIAGASMQATDEPTIYSGAGFPLTPPTANTIRGPNVIAPADQSPTLTGVLASGMHGGSYLALNGTSVAAPQLARVIADHLSAMLLSDLPLAGTVTASKIAASLAKNRKPGAPKAPPDARKGCGAIAAHPGKSLETLWMLRAGRR